MFVVNGRRHTSNPGDVERWAAEDGKAGAAARMTLTGRVTGEGAAEVSVALAAVDGKTPRVALELVAYENDLTTKITAGELKGETVNEWAVVRAVSAPFTADDKGGAVATLPIQRDWNLPRTGFIVIARDPASMSVAGAARILHSELAPAGK